MAQGSTFTTKLGVDVSGFLSALRSGLAQGTQVVTDFVTGAGKVKIKIPVDADEEEVRSKASKLKEILQGALSFAGGELLTRGLTAAAHGLENLAESGEAAVKRQEELEIGFSTAGVAADQMAGVMEKNKATTAKLSDEYAVSKASINDLTATYLKFGGSTDNLATKQELIIGLSKRAGIGYEQAAKALAKGTDPEIAAQLSKIGIKFESGATSAERFAIIQEKVGGTLEKMKEQASGPLGSLDRLKNSLGDLKDSLGSAIINAVGPLAKQLADSFKSIDFGTVFKGIGSSLSGLLAPAIAVLPSVIKTVVDTLNTVIPIATEIVKVATDLAPIILIGVGAWKAYGIYTTIATAAQELLNGAMAANPVGLVLIGVLALVAGLKLLADSQSHSIADAIEQNKAEQDLIAQQKEANQAQQDRVKSVKELAHEYESLGSKTNRSVEEEKKFEEVQSKLNATYPGLISSTKSFSENLGSVRAAAAGTKDELAKLDAQMKLLDERAKASAIRGLDLQVSQGMQDLTDTVKKTFATISALGINIGGGDVADAFFKDISRAISSTKSQADVDAVVTSFNDKLASIAKGGKITLDGKAFDGLKLDPKDELAIRASIAKVGQLRGSLINAVNGTGADASKDPLAAGSGTDAAGTDKTVQETLSFAQRVAEARKKANEILGQIDIANAKDELERINTTAKNRTEAITAQLPIDIKKAQDEAQKARDAGKNVDTQSLSDYIAALGQVAKNEQLKITQEQEKAIRDLGEKRLELERQNATQAASERKDQLQGELDTIIAQQELIGDTTAAAMQQRLDKLKEIQAQERAITLANLVSQSAEFKQGFAQLDKDLESGAIASAEEFARRLADLRTRLAATLANDPRLTATDTKNATGNAKSQEEIDLEHKREAIAKLKTLQEQADATDLLDLDTRHAREVAAAAGNQAQLLDLEERYQAARQAILDRAEHRQKGFWGRTLDDAVQALGQLGTKIAENAVEIGQTLGTAIAKHENLAKAGTKVIAKIAFDFLKQMIPIWTASFLGPALATPQSIITGGGAALAEWAALTGLLEGVVSAIQGTLGFIGGTPWVPGSGFGRDSVPAMLEPGERVVTRRHNIEHWHTLEAIRTNDPVAIAFERALREPRGFRYAIDGSGSLVHQEMALQAHHKAEAALAAVSDLSDGLQALQDIALATHREVASIAKTNEFLADTERFRPPSKPEYTP